MQAIAWRDRANPAAVYYVFAKRDKSRVERLREALAELRGLGNCQVYLVEVEQEREPENSKRRQVVAKVKRARLLFSR